MQAPTSISLTLILLLAGCRQIPPCQDCEDDAAEDDAPMSDLPAPPDLPCGGADLLTDNLNCGTCGHECGLWYPDTPLEAGTCVDGVCGPGWSDCLSDVSNASNCAEICALFEYSCVPNGCSGYTGAVYEIVGIDGVCGPIGSGPPDALIEGGCDAPIPWMSTSEWPREVMCCCDVQ